MNSLFDTNGVYILKGQHDGPISAIIAGTHGNESCGIKAFEKILPDLKIDAGTIYFIVGNPKAVEQNVRYTDFNLNRCFREAKDYSPKIKKTYEYKRATFIKSILKKVDALLDIHSTTNKGQPFIVTEKNALNIIKSFPARCSKVVFNFGTIEPGATDDYMYSQDKIGICVECGRHEDKNSSVVAEKSIDAFLHTRGHLKPKKTADVKREFLTIKKLHITKNNFTLVKKFVDFEAMKKGQEIGFDGTKLLTAPYDGNILFAHNCDKSNMEAFLYAKKV